MATTIAKASIQLSANAEQVTGELKKTETGVKAFSKKASDSIGGIKAHEAGEKMTAAFGRMRMVSGTFDALRSDADNFSKAVAVAEGTVGSLTLGLSAASKMASGLSGAMKGVIGVGIGLAVAGIGGLISWASGPSRREEEATRMTEGLSDESRRFLSDAGVTTTARMRRTELGMAERVEPTVTERDVELSRTVPTIREIGRGAEMASSARGREETALRVAETTLAAGRAAGDATPAFRAFAEEVERAGTAFRHAEGTRAVASIEEMARRSRDAAATTRMSAGEAEEYGLSLRRTTRRIGDFTVATTESLTPAEAHARRLEEIRRAEIASGMAVGAMVERREASRMAMLSEIAALDELRAARLAADSAAETRRTETPFAASAREMDRISDLFRRGGTDAATFGRGVEMAVGGAADPARTLADEMRRLDEIEVRATLAGVATGEAVDMRPIDRARDAARRAFLGDAAETPAARLGERLGELKTAFDAGTISADQFARAREAAVAGFTGDMATPVERLQSRLSDIASAWTRIGDTAGEAGEMMRRATTEAVRGITGDVRTPQERFRERMDELAAAEQAAFEARRVESMRTGEAFTFDNTDFERARARAITELETSVRIELPALPQALMRGSAEAVSAINAARRMGDRADPAVRMAALMERSAASEAETARSTRDLLAAFRATPVVAVRGI